VPSHCVVNPRAPMASLRHVHDDPFPDLRLVALLKERHRHVFITTMTAAGRPTWCCIPG
jgi:hypothetical protein